MEMSVEELAARDLERDPAEGLDAAEALLEAADLDGRRHRAQAGLGGWISSSTP
jgi:hypothetical protein